MGTSGDKILNLNLNAVHLSTLPKLRYLWELKIVIFLHRYLMQTA
jgi:hypothetical protein